MRWRWIRRFLVWMGLVPVLVLGCSSEEIQVPDATPPRAIDDLTLLGVNDTAYVFTWTAPGDDGDVGTAAAYDFRYSTVSLYLYWDSGTRVENEPPPKPAGMPETLYVAGIPEITVTTYFGVRSVDEVGNRSGFSNHVQVSPGGVPGLLELHPVRDLRVVGASATSVTLAWTAPGDTTASGYDLRYATSVIDSMSWDAAILYELPRVPGPPGYPEQVIVQGLQRDTEYFFGIKAIDRLGEPTVLSNLVSETTRRGTQTWEVFVDGSGDAPTVQAGIDSASWGDTVLVHPGTYGEAINFLGKNIVVKSLAGPEMTILDATGFGTHVVRFESEETREAVVQGFTITGGNGGILIVDAEPSIIDNVITGNGNISMGGGILCSGAYKTLWFPLIQRNVITNNQATHLAGGVGTLQNVVPEILDNYIADNEARDADGGGIYYRSNDNGAVIRGNTVVNNHAGDHGGGIYVWHVGDIGLLEVEVSWNLVIDNVADGLEGTGNSGGGIWFWETNAWIHHNTVVQSTGNGANSSYGGGIVIEKPGSPLVEYNIIALTTNGGGIWCGGEATPTIRNNLAWQNLPADGVGDCATWWQTNGNIVADPLFCDPGGGDFSVAGDSPALTHPAGPLGAIAEPGCPP